MLTLLQCFFVGWISPVYALRLKCADSPVAFEYEGSEEIKCVCETARTAVTFLKTLGMETTDVITIRLVDHFPSHQTHELFGCYTPNSREVDLLTYSKALELSQKNKSILGIGISEDIWCSYAAHELAHAISSQHISPEVKNHTAGEYLSAVTQLTVLTHESRKKILQKYQDIEAYKSINEMSIYYFLFAPNEFAVKCYLHFVSLDKPKEFVERLVNEENWSWDEY
jgi:hypothetical protein